MVVEIASSPEPSDKGPEQEAPSDPPPLEPAPPQRKPLALAVNCDSSPVTDDPGQLLLFEGAPVVRADPTIRAVARVEIPEFRIAGIPVYVLSTEYPIRPDIRLVVRSGSLQDPPGLAGCAHLLEHMLFVRPSGFAGAYDFQRHLAQHSLRANAETDVYTTRFTIDAPLLKRREAIQTLARMVGGPEFTDAELETEKTVIHTERLQKLSDAHSYYRWAGALPHLFGVPPAASLMIGTEETCAKITRDDLMAFRAAHYHPDNAFIFALCSDPAAMLRDLESAFAGSLPYPPAGAAATPVEQPQRAYGSPIEVAPLPFNGVAMIVAFRGISRADPDFGAACVLRALLTGSLWSRLSSSLRLQEGMAYAPTMRNDEQPAGAFEIAHVFLSNQDQAQRAVESFRRVCDALAGGKINAEELELARLMARENIPHPYSADWHCSNLASLGQIVPVDKLALAIEHASLDDVARVAATMLDLSKARVAVGGQVDPSTFRWL